MPSRTYHTGYDSNVVTISKKRTGGGSSSSSKLGTKKYGAGGNAGSRVGVMGSDTRKLDEATDAERTKYIPLEWSKKIQQARCEKKMTQKEVANRLNMKQNDYQKYENGKAVLNQQVVSRIERVLGTRVRPFKSKKKKKN
eukprot:g1050.t1